MGDVWKIFGLVALSGLIGAAYAFGLSLYGLAPRLDAESWRFFGIWVIFVSSAALTFGLPLIYLFMRPLGIASRQINSEKQLTQQELASAQKLMFNLPRILAILSMLLWIVPLLSLPIASIFTEHPPDTLSQIIAVVATIGIGIVHATFVIYLVEWYVRKRFVPIFKSDGMIKQNSDLQPISLGLKLILLFATTGLFPIFGFTVLLIAGTASLEAVLFLFFASVGIGIGQSLMILSSIARPIGNLHSEMAKIREGNLETRVTVESCDRLGQLSEGFNEMVAGLEQAEFVERTFGSYVSRPVLDEILEGKISMGGERRTATILFSDIRNFTSLSETSTPEDVVHFLNHYLDSMVDALVAHGATVDKFIGDAILAVFNVPLSQADHADRAVSSALDMLKRLEDINAERRQAGNLPLEIGIGIHTGPVVAGNIGSAKKMEYTVIGDAVNTAARLEELNKSFDTRLLISGETKKLLETKVTTHSLGPVELKGKQQKVEVFEVSGPVETTG
jgi:adenylate cyclase